VERKGTFADQGIAGTATPGRKDINGNTSGQKKIFRAPAIKGQVLNTTLGEQGLPFIPVRQKMRNKKAGGGIESVRCGKRA
jgi:hypothetical protein